MKITVYQKIGMVLEKAGRALAAHEFASVEMPTGELSFQYLTGREYVGCSEATLGRRLREMRELGMVTAKRRDGKAFVEYALPVPVQPEFPDELVAA